MTLYDPNINSVVDRNPNYSYTKSERFQNNEQKIRNQLRNVPNQYNTRGFIEDPRHGFTMSTGKCWTLKMSKEDETTPGPAYNTQYLNSISRKVDMTDELKQSSFGAFKDK